MKAAPFWSSFLLLVAVVGGCAHRRYIPNTTIPDNEQNRKIFETIEDYRARLKDKNIDALLILASPKYFEDSGTPRPDDDYHYGDLKGILTTRLERLRSLSYDIQYRNLKVKKIADTDIAEVEVFINGAFEVMAETGDRYKRVSDFHRFVLERVGPNKWKFLSGM